MAILVTGGAGYIGSVMVEILRRQGIPVVVVDDLSRGHRAAIEADVPFWEGNVGDRDFLDRLFESVSCEAVLHFAASSLVGESMRHPGDYFRNNVGGLTNLVSTMIRHGVKRFILSSTAATYGNPRTVPIPETAPARPTNPYGESKLMCETILRWFGQIHGLAWTALRYFNASGATTGHGEDHREETHLIPIALRSASGRSDALTVFGLDYPTADGTCVRDYIHVEDLADAHLLALQALERGAGDIYNLGNGRGFSVLDVVAAVERTTGRQVVRRDGSRRPGDPPILVASSEKARRNLGWEPKHGDLDHIVQTAWRWMEAHPDGYGEPAPS